MNLRFRILDLSGLNLTVDVPENTTIKQLTSILDRDYGLKTDSCIFSAKGLELSPETSLISNLLAPKFTMTMYDTKCFAQKSFPRIENAFPNQYPKYCDFFQEQPSLSVHSNNKGRRGSKAIFLDNDSRLVDLIQSAIYSPDEMDRLIDNLREYRIDGEPIEYGFLDADQDDYAYEDEDENENEDEEDLIEFEDMDGLGPFPHVIRVVDHNLPLYQNIFALGDPLNRQIEEQVGSDEVDDVRGNLPPEIVGFEENMSSEQKEVIDRICERTEIDRSTVIQVFEACDRNEDLATNCLISMR